MLLRAVHRSLVTTLFAVVFGGCSLVVDFDPSLLVDASVDASVSDTTPDFEADAGLDAGVDAGAAD